jgi:hypothetical protein
MSVFKNVIEMSGTIMRRIDFPLYAVALCWLSCTQPVKAMLSTSNFPDESADQVRQAITRRLASEISPENARRYNARESSPEKQAFKYIKQVPSVSLKADDDSSKIGARLKAQRIAAVGVAIGCLATLLAMLTWVTRRAQQSRERDRLAALRSIRPSLAEPEQLEQSEETDRKRTPTVSLQELWAKRSESLAKLKFEKADGCSTPTPI